MTLKESVSLQELAQELVDEARPKTLPATEALQAGSRPHYSPEAMVQLMVEHPEYSHAQLAAHFGRAPSWLSAVLASDRFQMALDPVRHLIADPALTASMEERFKALALRSTTVLQEKLNTTGVSDLVVLKSLEIGVKALGLGQRAPELPPPAAAQNASESVAEKLLRAMDERDRSRTIDAEVVEVRNG